MEVEIKRRNQKGEEKKWNYFYFIPEESIYENERIMFAHFMWHKLASKELNPNIEYIRDFASYDCQFNRLSYSGEGFYFKGKKVIGVDDLDNGFRSVEIENYLYFIDK